MGNLTTDTQNVLNDIGISNATAIKPITDLIGLIFDVGGGVGGINNIVQFIEAWLGTTQLDQIQNALRQIGVAIQTGFHQIQQDQAATDLMNRNSALWTLDFTQALAKLQGLKAEISAQPSPSDVVGYIQPCIKALDDLSGGPAQPNNEWNMTYDAANSVYWSDVGLFESTCFYPLVGGGYNQISADAGYGTRYPAAFRDGTVWVYTYSLPFYLFATSIFLAVAGSLDPNYVGSYADSVLKPAANLLQSVYDQITKQGLTPLCPSNWAQIGMILTACPSPVSGAPPPPGNGIILIYSNSNPRQVVGASIEYGAVEKYSGCSSIGSGYVINILKASDNTDRGIFNKLQIRLAKRMKDVTIAIGLPGVWRTINQLYSLAGSPTLPPPGPGDWSLRQIFALAQLPSNNSVLSARSLAVFLIQTQPFDTPYTGLYPHVTVSVRELLTNFPN